MPSPDETIAHGTLRRLVDAGVPVAAEAVGTAGGWSVVIHCGRIRQTLAVTRGQPRTFRKFETLVSYLKNLGIADLSVHIAAFEPVAVYKATDRRREVASERMKRTHEAAAHDQWFRAQVQASLDDPRPGVSAQAAGTEFAARREGLRKRAAGASPRGGTPRAKAP